MKRPPAEEKPKEENNSMAQMDDAIVGVAAKGAKQSAAAKTQ